MLCSKVITHPFPTQQPVGEDGSQHLGTCSKPDIVNAHSIFMKKQMTKLVLSVYDLEYYLHEGIKNLFFSCHLQSFIFK